MEAIFANNDDQRIIDRGTTLAELKGSAAGAELNKMLNEAVADVFQLMLAAKTTDELLDLRGQARAYMAITESIDANVREAGFIAKRLRESIEEARERNERTVGIDEERRFRSSATSTVG